MNGERLPPCLQPRYVGYVMCWWSMEGPYCNNKAAQSPWAPG